MKRAFDLILATLLIVALAPVGAAVALAVRVSSRGPVLHVSRRVGRRGALFPMPKFRTMRIETPQVATHLLEDPDRWLTPLGGVLRRSSLDELPQLISILRGDMSFVGPRPALFNQHDLVALRREAGIDALRPGLTGWAQVNGRDELTVAEKVGFDAEYLRRRGFWFDLKVIGLTAWKCLRAEGVKTGPLAPRRAA